MQRAMLVTGGCFCISRDDLAPNFTQHISEPPGGNFPKGEKPETAKKQTRK